MIHHAATKFDKTKVIYSELLPRQDIHGDKINKINHVVRQNCRASSNVHVIQHENIKGNHLFVDPKHLNRHGVALFATNLKRAIFGTLPRKRKLNRRQSESTASHRIGILTRAVMTNALYDDHRATRMQQGQDRSINRLNRNKEKLINQQLKLRVRLLMMLPMLVTP